MSNESLDCLKAFVRQYPLAKNAAKRLKISPQYLCDMLKGNRRIPDDILNKTGFKRTVKVEPLNG